MMQRIRHRKAGPHIPGATWQATACLCDCHYATPDTCDVADCRSWRRQNSERAQAIMRRRQQRIGVAS